MEARHEPGVAAAVRPQADAGRHAPEARHDAPLHLHPRAEIDLAEARGQRGLEAVEDVRLRVGQPDAGDGGQVGGRDRDLGQARRGRPQDRESEGREGDRRQRQFVESDRQSGDSDPEGGQQREADHGESQEADRDLRESDAEDHEHLGGQEDEGDVEGEDPEQRHRRDDGPACGEDDGGRREAGGEARRREQAHELEGQVCDQVLARPHVRGEEEIELGHVGRDAGAEGIEEADGEDGRERRAQHEDRGLGVQGPQGQPDRVSERVALWEEDQDQSEVGEGSETAAQGRSEEEPHLVGEEGEGASHG